MEPAVFRVAGNRVITAARWHLIGLALGLGAPAMASAQGASQPGVPELETAAAADSNSPEAHYTLAMGYWSARRWEDAERELHVTTSIAPAFAEAWLALGGLFEARGAKYWMSQIKARGIDAVYEDYETSRRHERHAFLIDPMVDLASAGLTNFKEEPRIVLKDGDLVPAYSAWWVPDLEWSINDLQQGQPAVALKRLQRIINDRRIVSDSSAPDVILWYHGLAAAHAGEFAAAVRDFYLLTGHANADLKEGRKKERGREELDYSANDYRYMLATVLFRGGRLAEAIAYYKKVLESDLGFYPAHSQLARIYGAAGRWAEAVNERQAAVAANPDDPSLLVDLGGALIRAGRPGEAVEPLREAGRLNPRDPLAPYLLGRALEQSGQADQAREAFGRFLAVAPASYASQAAEVRTHLAQ